MLVIMMCKPELTDSTSTYAPITTSKKKVNGKENLTLEEVYVFRLSICQMHSSRGFVVTESHLLNI